MPDSVIVYRSPLEKAVAEFWWDNPGAVGWLCAGLLVLAAVLWGRDKWRRRRLHRRFGP